MKFIKMDGVHLLLDQAGKKKNLRMECIKLLLQKFLIKLIKRD